MAAFRTLNPVAILPQQDDWQYLFLVPATTLGGKSFSDSMKVGNSLKWNDGEMREIDSSEKNGNGYLFTVKDSTEWYFARQTSEGNIKVWINKQPDNAGTGEKKQGKDAKWVEEQIYKHTRTDWTSANIDVAMEDLVGIYAKSDRSKESLGKVAAEIKRELYEIQYAKKTGEYYENRAGAVKKLIGAPKELGAAVKKELVESIAGMINYISTSPEFQIFSVTGWPLKFSSNPKIIGFGEYGSFLLDVIPEKFYFAQGQLDLVDKFIKTPEGAEKFLVHMQAQTGELYAEIGLPGQEYVLSASDKEKAKKNMWLVRKIAGMASNSYGGMLNYDTKNIDIDTTSTMYSKILRHEIGHSMKEWGGEYKEGQDWKTDMDFWLNEGINSILTKWSYPTVRESILKYLKSASPDERKRSCDALVKYEFGIATKEDMKVAVEAIKKAQKYVQ